MLCSSPARPALPLSPPRRGGKPGVAVTPVCPMLGALLSIVSPTPPWQLLLFSPELGHLLSVVSFNFYLFLFLNQRPLTPRERRARCQTPPPSLLPLFCSKSWVCFRRTAQAPGLLQPDGGQCPQPRCQAEPGALGSVGSQHFITRSSEQPARASIGNWAHSPAPSASPCILHWTPPSKYLFLVVF